MKPTRTHPPCRRLRAARLFALLASALLLLLPAGCRRAEPPELRLGISVWPGTEFIYLAKEKGFFAAEGLNVRLVDYTALGDVRVAFEAGQVDGAAMTLIEVLQARENSHRQPRVAVVLDHSNGADVILAREDITSLAELKGQRIGVELGSLSVFMLVRALDRVGLKLSDVEVVACPPSHMAEAMARGKVDAVVTYPPISVPIEARGDMRRLFTSAEIPGEVVDVIAIDHPALAQQPGFAARFSRALQRAFEYAQAHPAEAYGFMGQREGVSAAEFRASLAGIHLVSAAEQAAYLRPGGTLERVIPIVADLLLATGQIHQQHRTSDLLPAASPAAP